MTAQYYTEEFDTGYLTRDAEDRIVLLDPDVPSGPFGGWEGKGVWGLVPANEAIRARRLSLLRERLVDRWGRFVGAVMFAALQARDARMPTRRSV